MLLYKFIGALGLLLISAGIINKKRIIQDGFYIIGGICLEIYSIYLSDFIFIILQIIFTKEYKKRNKAMKNPKIILATSSPYRQQAFEMLGLGLKI